MVQERKRRRPIRLKWLCLVPTHPNRTNANKTATILSTTFPLARRVKIMAAVKLMAAKTDNVRKTANIRTWWTMTNGACSSYNPRSHCVPQYPRKHWHEAFKVAGSEQAPPFRQSASVEQIIEEFEIGTAERVLFILTELKTPVFQFLWCVARDRRRKGAPLQTQGLPRSVSFEFVSSINSWIAGSTKNDVVCRCTQET